MVFTDNGKMPMGKICILSIPKCTLRNVVDATRMVDLCLFLCCCSVKHWLQDYQGYSFYSWKHLFLTIPDPIPNVLANECW
jgi:hypothetical protein